MKRLLLILIFASLLPAAAGVTALNAENLIGTWRIYDESNTEQHAINITLAITSAGVSRFTYKVAGAQAADNEQVQGLMVNQNQIIIEKFEPGQANTYVFQIDFEANGGPGLLLKTVYADCTEVGANTSLVKAKYKERLASSSQLCTQRAIEVSTLTNFKMVKDGTAATSISTTATIPAEFSSNLATVEGQIESAWKMKSIKKDIDKFLVKNTSANFLGYQFIYRIINKKQKLKELTESSFKSSERIGLLLDEYLVMNNSYFKEKNGLTVIDLNTKRRTGKGNFIQTPNSDCFPRKSGASDTRVCTPNFDSGLANSISKLSSKASAQRINTKTKISF